MTAHHCSLTIDQGRLTITELRRFGSSTHTTFTITNTGGATAMAMSGGGLAAPYEFKGGGDIRGLVELVLLLAAGNTCTVVVTYNPRAPAYPDTIEISYNDGVAAQIATRNVVGSGVACCPHH